MMRDQESFKIVIQPAGAPDRILPREFWDILVHRYVPVLSFTYVCTILGIALRSSDFVHSLLFDAQPYQVSLFVGLWVSIPAVIWVLMRGTPLLVSHADLWYKMTAGVMTLTLIVSYVLLPEANLMGMHLRTYFVATIPVFFMMYLFFVKGGLPPVASYPLSAMGFVFLLYGSFLKIF